MLRKLKIYHTCHPPLLTLLCPCGHLRRFLIVVVLFPVLLAVAVLGLILWLLLLPFKVLCCPADGARWSASVWDNMVALPARVIRWI